MPVQKDWGNVMAKTKRWKLKTSRIRKQIFIGHRKEICGKRIRTTGSSVGIGTLSIIHIRKANRTINRPPSVGTINQKKSNEQKYSARQTRWLDRLALFDINIIHIAGKHLALTDYLSKNPISKPEPIENYNEKYVNNCIMPLLEFINNYGSVASQKNLEARTDQNEQREQIINQSERSRPNKPKPKENKANKRSSSLPHSKTVDTNKLNTIQSVQEITMDIRRIEQIEKKDHSKEILNLTKRWRELVKPGEYRTSNGVWEKYNPPRHHRAEIKRIEMTLNQRRNRMLWDRMGEQDGEAEEETERRNELYRVFEKIRILPQKQ